jgi:hypothetical protein
MRRKLQTVTLERIYTQSQHTSGKTVPSCHRSVPTCGNTKSAVLINEIIAICSRGTLHNHFRRDHPEASCCWRKLIFPIQQQNPTFASSQGNEPRRFICCCCCRLLMLLLPIADAAAAAAADCCSFPSSKLKTKTNTIENSNTPNNNTQQPTLQIFGLQLIRSGNS